MKKNYTEIQLLRAFAIIGVIFIHLLNTGLGNMTKGSSGYDFFYFWQHLLNFSVPAFIFMTAFVCTVNLGDKPINARSFYKKKAVRVLVPYILWSGAYLLVLYVTGIRPLSSYQNPENWLRWIFLGKSYEHLYFLAIIIGFFIFAPLLMKLARKVKDSLWLGLLIGFGGQVIVYWINKLWIYDKFPYITTTFIWYWAICFLGLFIGFNYEKLLAWLDRRMALVSVVFTAALGGYLYYIYLLLNGTAFNTFYYNIVWQLFVWGMIFLLLQLSRRISTHGGKLSYSLDWLGKYSFGIFLIHPALTYFFNLYVQTENAPLLTAYILAACGAIAIVTGFITKYLERFPLTSVFFGILPKK